MKDEVNALECEGSSLADLVALQVGTVGENMALRRAAYLKTTPSTILGTYIHASGKYYLFYSLGYGFEKIHTDCSSLVGSLCEACPGTVWLSNNMTSAVYHGHKALNQTNT